MRRRIGTLAVLVLCACTSPDVQDAALPDAGGADAGAADAAVSDAGLDAGLDAGPGRVGPLEGALLVHGGGANTGPEALAAFATLIGGLNAPVVVVPTASEPPPLTGSEALFTGQGFTDVTVLHTTDPDVANTDAFVEPIRRARGVYFTGGRQWRLADAYLGTLTEDELWNLLGRGGAIGGSSAGATIQGSFLFRGDTLSNTVLIGDHVEGFGFLEGVGIDQHIAQRGRETDLFALIESEPGHLGLGLDERTSIVVRGDTFEVLGEGRVYVHHRALWDGAATDEERYLVLTAGDRYDMDARAPL